MPEYPDIMVYEDALRRHCVGRALRDIRVKSPFLLRTVEPPLDVFDNQIVGDVEHIGKRIVLVFPKENFLVIHLMIAGRLRLKPPRAKIPGKVGLAAFDFDDHTIIFTEASSHKRASLHAVQGRANLAAFDRGGADVLRVTTDVFRQAICQNNHTLKRALTDPRYLAGIGNSYSDEILFRAKLPPLKRTASLSASDAKVLHTACKKVLVEWRDTLIKEVGNGFPDKVTAFRPDMAVHGKFGQPCRVCGNAIQRIRYANHETNYCAHCQNGGKLYADRAISRLLKEDWPRTLEELEELKIGM